MNWTGGCGAGGGRIRAVGILCCLGIPMLGAIAAVADLAPVEEAPEAPELTAPATRKADALAWFANGLFEEESEGPETAIESYRKSLALDPGNADLAVKVAYDYLRRNETAEAISVLKDAVKAAPKEMAPFLALSSIYLRHLQKPDFAVKYAQMALEISPTAIAPYEALWEVYVSTGQNARAEQLLDKAGRSKSTDASFWISLAELGSRNVIRDTSASLTDSEMLRVSSWLGKAAECGQKDPAALSKTGDLYVLLKQTDKAMPLYEKVVAMKPAYPQAREKLAACLMETGRNDDAIRVIEEIVKVNPLNLAAYDQLTQLHLKSANLTKALANSRQALVMDPTALSRHIQVIDLLFKTKDYPNAAVALAEARKRFPQTGLLTYYHAVALSQTKQHDEAMRAFERALVEAGNSQPDLLNADFYFDYGAAAEQAGQHVKATELFRKSIDMDPSGAARAYNYLGYMWVERNENLEEAGKLIRRALEMEPGNGAYLDSLGWLYFRQSKYEEALTELLRAAEALPESDAVVFEHIGDTYEKLGRQAEAVLYWQKGLQLDPESKGLAARLDEAAKKVVQQPAANSVNSKPQPPSQ